MQRGHRSLFQDLFPDEVVLPQEPKRKSRNPQLHALRNELVITRYYYYSTLAKIEKRTYMWVLENLEQETFLCQRTLINIIGNDKHIITKLRHAKPSKEALKKKYPWLVWRDAMNP